MPGRFRAYMNAWEKHVADVARRDPAEAAKLWQGHGSYPGVDAWRNLTLRKKTVLQAGFPGPSGFAVPDGTVAALNNDASSLARGSQVGPNGDYPLSPYRSQAVRIRLNRQTAVASSKALANPQYGEGGLTQYYISDFAARVLRRQVTVLDASGAPVRFVETADGGLKFFPPDGPTFMLHGFESSTDPTVQEVARMRPVLHQVAPQLVLAPNHLHESLSQ